MKFIKKTESESELKVKPGDVIEFWDDGDKTHSAAMITCAYPNKFSSTILSDSEAGNLASNGLYTDWTMDEFKNYPTDVLREYERQWDHVKVINAELREI